jgi:hypothetical protein
VVELIPIYGYFLCAQCEDRWAEELPPMESEDWPKCCNWPALLVTPLVRVED